MSSVYATEPATSGRIIFDTSHGPLDVRLWSRECPATVRLILQLCRDGYYDDTIFHRIVPQLLIQTGAVRRTNQQPPPTTSKESTQHSLLQQYRQAIAADEALARRRYETNVRIRFNHRGQVALAINVPEDGGDDSSTASWWPPQFFITTEAAEHLDGQHVIFGTLGAGGPTMFNAIRIAQTFTGDDTTAGVGWEEDAPYIRSVKIVEHPCPEQMMEVSSLPGGLPWKQQQQPKEDESQNAMPKKKKKRKGKLDVNFLSFGDEVDWGEGGGVATSTKTKSNRKQPQSLSNRHTEDTTNDNHITSASHHRAMQSSSPDHQHQLLTGTDNNIESLANSNDRHAEAQTGFLDPSRAETDDAEEFKSVNFIPQKSKDEPGKDLQGNQSARELGEKEDSQLKMLDASSSRISSKNNNAEERTTVSLVEARRARYTTRRSKDKKQRGEDTLARLEAFQSKVRTTVTGSARGAANDKDDSLAARMARRADPQPFSNDNNEEAVTYHGQILDEDDEDDGDDPNRWMRTKFKCRRHMDHEAAGDGRDAMKDYKVEDDRGQRQQSTNGSHQHKRHKKHTDRHHHHPSTKEKHNDHHHHPRHRG